MKLLIIDDDRAILESLELVLELDHEVTTAASAVEGLRVAEAGSFDAILLDLMMPGIDGLEVKRRLDAGGVKTPVLILSARNNVEEAAKSAGAAGFLVKPFRVEALEKLLAQLPTAA
ncbi:response regulator transcription factor [Vulgatibacter sp.]|uniref:response regulator transcription factor n=1 Tax=Vulgatibacter sp. TaxID=1971226 RepID=UPI00356AF9CF